MTLLENCRVVDLRKISRLEGNITPVEGGRDIPFEIERVYYLYDVPGGADRGGHAHKQLEQLIVAAMGSFRVIIDDGRRRRSVTLDRAYFGLYMPRLIWREIVDFSAGGVCLVLASRAYQEDDYIRDYSHFVQHKFGNSDPVP
jgi:hypothetical protein